MIFFPIGEFLTFAGRSSNESFLLGDFSLFCVFFCCFVCGFADLEVVVDEDGCFFLFAVVVVVGCFFSLSFLVVDDCFLSVFADDDVFVGFDDDDAVVVVDFFVGLLDLVVLLFVDDAFLSSS